MKNPLPLEASWWAELRTLFIMSKSTNFTLPPYVNFSKYYEKPFIVGIVMKSRFQKTFWNIEGYYFYAAAIFNFLRYYEKYFTFGLVIMSRIQKTFQNVEVYYFYAAAMCLFSKILWNIHYRSKGHYEQNSDHFSEGRSVLLLWIRHLLIL